MRIKPYHLLISILLLAWFLWACRLVTGGTPTSPPPTPTDTPPPQPTPTQTAQPLAMCHLGAGLRLETIPILQKYKPRPAYVMTGGIRIAAEQFPKFQGWFRVIGAPSLEELQRKAEQAEKQGIPYEALAYGLETGATTPEEEWKDLIGSTQKARAIADRFEKLLVMAPGPRLIQDNPDKYAPMAALADLWVFQAQIFQKDPPGQEFREKVAQVLEQIEAGNPNISIWAQIVLPPDHPPDPAEWLAYHQSIEDLVEGSYIGAYTWAIHDPALITGAIDSIFAAVCEGER